MKKYKLVFTPQLSFEFSAKEIKANLPDNWQEFFYRVSNVLAAVLILFLGAKVLLLAINSTSPASMQLYTLVTIEVALAMIFIWQLMTVGWKRFIDPPGFIGILVFALVAILAWIFAPNFIELGANQVSQYRGLSTFGTITTKSIAGLSLIGLVGVFYFANLFLDNTKKVGRAAWVMLLLFMTGAIANVLFTSSNNVIDLTVFAALAVLTLWQLGKILPSRGVFLVVLVAVSQLSMFVNSDSELWKVHFAAIVAALMWLWVWLLVENFTISFAPQKFWQDIKKLFKSKTTLEKVVDKHKLIVVLLLVSVTGVGMVLWMLINKIDIGDDVQQLLSDLNSSLFQSKSIGEVWFGNVLVNGVSAARSTLVNVAYSQGLLGVIAYVMLGFTGFFLSVRGMLREGRADKKPKFPIATILAGVIFLIPILGLLLNLSLLLIVTWWLCLGIVTASYYLPERKNLEVALKFRLFRFEVTRFLPWIRLILAVLCIWAWVAINSGLINLVDKGTI